LIVVAIELPLEARTEEAMFERKASEVTKASKVCLQKEQAVWIVAK
jgi:hypothetical protein